MSNATSKVKSFTTPWGDDKIYRPLAATAATYYSGMMIALNSDGNAVKCTDTTGLRFDGLMADSPRIEVESGDSAGDKKIMVEKPWLLGMKTNFTASRSHIGSKVYAVDDQTVGLTSSNSILIGVIEDLVTVVGAVTATMVLIRPYWTSTSGVNAFDGETITFAGATGQNELLFPDNLAIGLRIAQGANNYQIFNSTDTTGEEVQFIKRTLHGDNVNIAFGDARDIYGRWDGTDFDLLAIADDTILKLGNGTNSFDVWVYGNEAGSYALFDASANKLAMTGNYSLKPAAITDTGNGNAISNLASGVCPIVSVGAETRTLDLPAFIGQEMILNMKTDGGNVVVTVTGGVNEAGNNTINFFNTGQSLVIRGVEQGAGLVWRNAQADGAELSTV